MFIAGEYEKQTKKLIDELVVSFEKRYLNVVDIMGNLENYLLVLNNLLSSDVLHFYHSDLEN
jgi:hypothetical protein